MPSRLGGKKGPLTRMAAPLLRKRMTLYQGIRIWLTNRGQDASTRTV
jgi:hypothetical protein